MKKLSLLVSGILICLTAICQSPLTWSAHTEKDADNAYRIVIDAVINDGWHVYAEDSKEDDLEGLKVSWTIQSIKANGPVTSSVIPGTITDAIFQKSFKVYTGKQTLTQKITTEPGFPAELTITLKGYAANATEFIPIEETKTIKFEGGSTASGADNIKIANLDLKSPVIPFGDRSSLF